MIDGSDVKSCSEHIEKQVKFIASVQTLGWLYFRRKSDHLLLCQSVVQSLDIPILYVEVSLDNTLSPTCCPLVCECV